MDKNKTLYENGMALYQKYKEPLHYIIFGVLTTLVNYVVYFLCLDLLAWHYLVVNVLAWVVSVLFAYATNRKWVFESKAKGWHILKEMVLFFASRLASLGAEMLLLFLMVDTAHLHNGMSKVVAGVVVIILNYILSKLIVFRKNTKKGSTSSD